MLFFVYFADFKETDFSAFSTNSNISFLFVPWSDGLSKFTGTIIVIQFNYYLFTCRLHSPETTYKVSMSKKKKETKQGNTYKEYIIIAIIIIIINIDNNNSIKFLFICVLTQQPKRQLQGEHE
jgi:hypothetical protein